MSSSNKLVFRARTKLITTKIPPYRKKLLFISQDEPRGHGFGLQFTISISDDGNVNLNQEIPDDPSTIYLTLPVVKPSSYESVPQLPYFPSYREMTPEQRGLYLYWLCDVTKKIDIGYVFVYYYGLERHLVYGDFDAAVNEILLLRNHHDNGSFQNYSASALVHSCLLRKRIDKLEELYEKNEFNYFDNSILLIHYYNDLDLLPDIMFQLASYLPGVNRRYLRMYPELYKKKISEVLSKKFGKASYPLSNRFSLKDVEGIPYPIFANISFPPEIRTPSLPNFLRHAPFQNEMNAIYKEVHESVKNELKSKRQKKKEKNI